MVQLEQRAQESPEKAASDSLTENFAAPKATDPEKPAGIFPAEREKALLNRFLWCYTDRNDTQEAIYA